MSCGRVGGKSSENGHAESEGVMRPLYTVPVGVLVVLILCLIVLCFDIIVTPPTPKPVYNDSELRQRLEKLEEIVGLTGEEAQPTGLQHKKNKK